METWQLVVAIAGSITIPLVVLILLLVFSFRPWIRDTIRAELGDFKAEVEGRLSRMEGRLDQLGDELGRLSTLIAQLVASRLKSEPNPPVSRRNELLEKWETGRLDYAQSVELRQMLEDEARRTEDESRRNLIILAQIGLVLYALSRRQ